MSEISVGLRGEQRVLVTTDIAVDFMGQEGARVLGTPYLIGLLEMTARNSVKPLLDDGFDTVGTEVCVKHLAATPLGMHVTFQSEVLESSDRRIKFRVEAFDEKEKVAEGTHERFIINVARFATRLAAKKTSA
jgi:fluoroacetyl-CoA thioesterase